MNQRIKEKERACRNIYFGGSIQSEIKCQGGGERERKRARGGKSESGEREREKERRKLETVRGNSVIIVKAIENKHRTCHRCGC